MFAARGRQRLGLDQRLRQGVRSAPDAAHLAQIGALVIVERLALGLLEQALQRRLGGELMQQAAHFGQRQRARLVALGRHIGRLVPLGD